MAMTKGKAQTKKASKHFPEKFFFIFSPSARKSLKPSATPKKEVTKAKKSKGLAYLIEKRVTNKVF